MRQPKSRNKGSAGNNRKTSDEFLKQNRTKSGIHESESGLQYSILEHQPNEPQPSSHSTVEIHQRAQLLNGTILEDSYQKNSPVTVKIDELIEGLQEGITLMTKGSRFKFWIPPHLAWGKKGSGNKIPPFALLQFDIRLIHIID